MFISKPINGVVFFAERWRKNKLLWSMIIVAGDSSGVRLEPGQVPARVRTAAHRVFANDGRRQAYELG
jgi:hypothetical protein